jgi:hypothetical protein
MCVCVTITCTLLALNVGGASDMLPGAALEAANPFPPPPPPPVRAVVVVSVCDCRVYA